MSWPAEPSAVGKTYSLPIHKAGATTLTVAQRSPVDFSIVPSNVKLLSEVNALVPLPVKS